MHCKHRTVLIISVIFQCRASVGIAIYSIAQQARSELMYRENVGLLKAIETMRM